MERIHSINPARIDWCCTDMGITPHDLASDLSISVATIDRVMNGEDAITFNQLQKISDYFGRGVLFFLESGPVDEALVHSPQFRTLANQKPDLSNKLRLFIERVEKQRSIFLSLLEELETDDQPLFTPPEFPIGNIKEAAIITREWLQLKDTNNFDNYRAAVESKGILVFRSNGYSGKWQISKRSPILGFTLYDSVCPVIVIKKVPWDPQMAFTLIHELGHLLLSKTSSIDDEIDIYSHQHNERDSNAFAGYLLVPDSFLIMINDSDRPSDVSDYDEWLSLPRKKWGISSEVILRRLLDVGRLSQNKYHAYRQWRSQASVQEAGSGTRMYRYREPKNIFGDYFVRTVFEALNTQRITLAKASNYLDNLKIKDLHKLEHYYAGL